MTDTPADPIAAEAREIAARVLIEHFDAELNRSPADPIGARTRLTDRMAAAFAQRQQSAGRAEESAWRRISKDCLPEDGKYYHVWAKFPGRMDVYMFERRQVGWSWQGLYGYEPTHFMLLPPPPEGGDA